MIMSTILISKCKHYICAGLYDVATAKYVIYFCTYDHLINLNMKRSTFIGE